MASDPFTTPPTIAPPTPVPLGGNRAQTIQRLQVGVFGLLVMVLLIGLASVILSNARRNQDTVSTQASASSAVSSGEGAANDPLADAGVVPDMPTAAKSPPRATRTAPGP